MKNLKFRSFVAALIIACFTVTAQAQSKMAMSADSGKMAKKKMSRMAMKKTDKMAMKKDTAKKISKMKMDKMEAEKAPVSKM